jgi:hypothetical protein
LPEIQERCRAYHLPGGTAEYGSVFYNHLTGEVKPLLSPGEQAGLDHLRAALGRVEGVQLDLDFHYAVRAYRQDAGGNRRGLPGAIIKKALAEIDTGTNIRPIPGDAQTDFMFKGVDKGTGLQALVRNFTRTESENQKAQIKLAIGDTVSDLPMFRLANFAVAPAHATALQKLDIPITARPYQAGLALGVEAFLGHFSGACATCCCPVFSSETRLLLDLLGAMDKGVWGKLKQLYLLRGLKL